LTVRHTEIGTRDDTCCHTSLGEDSARSLAVAERDGRYDRK